MESQKSKNRKLFNILLFIFAAIAFYIHMTRQRTQINNPAIEEAPPMKTLPDSQE